jgi:hypothetical protein
VSEEDKPAALARPEWAGLIPHQFKPGQSGNPTGRNSKGLVKFREAFGGNLVAYGKHLHDLATSPNKQQLEALRLMLGYLLGPPNVGALGDQSELAGMTLEELKDRARAILLVRTP